MNQNKTKNVHHDGIMTMTNKKSAQVRLRAQRGKLLKYHHKGHIVLVLMGGFCVVWTIHLRLISTSSEERHLATLPLSSPSSSLSHLVTEQNVTTTYRHDVQLSFRPSKPVTIAYAISLIKCGDFQSSAAGMTDAALVLRHSIHQTSARNADAHSHYDYKMYAIVHSQAAECSHLLRDAGFEIVIKDAPIQQNEIRGEFLRKKIHKEWCCGAAEFIKLYAYTLPEPIVVHMDIDFVFRRPMDDVFDALLYDKDSDIGKAARERIPRERSNDPWPDRPQAMMTRDWPQVVPEPGRRVGYQAGFLVARTNPVVTDELIEIIRQGHYVGAEVKNVTNMGWGGLGYGGFVGAMTMQGLLAYYYDIIAPDTWVELNQCRFNHMGMDVLYRSQPKFEPGHVNRGKCRNNRNDCEDCMHTEMDSIYNIHFAQCRKPWNCIGEGNSRLPRAKKRKPRIKTAAEKLLIPEDSVHLDHCMQLHTIWHGHRRDLESKVRALVQAGAAAAADANKNETTTTNAIDVGIEGDYKKEFFQGHCKGNGPDQYLLFSSGNADFIKRIPELYDY